MSQEVTTSNPFDALELEARNAILRGIGRAYSIVFSPRPAQADDRAEAEALMFPPLPAVEDRPARRRKEPQ